MTRIFTKNFLFEELKEAQDRADLIVNDTFRAIDMLLFGTIIDSRNAPPASPVAYQDMYEVGSTPTGL